MRARHHCSAQPLGACAPMLGGRTGGRGRRGRRGRTTGVRWHRAPPPPSLGEGEGAAGVGGAPLASPRLPVEPLSWAGGLREVWRAPCCPQSHHCHHSLQAPCLHLSSSFSSSTWTLGACQPLVAWTWRLTTRWRSTRGRGTLGGWLSLAERAQQPGQTQCPLPQCWLSCWHDQRWACSLRTGRPGCAGLQTPPRPQRL